MIFAAATLALQLSSSSAVAAASCENPDKGASVLKPVEPELSDSQIKQAHAPRAALISVSIATDGSVQSVAIAQSSGNATVDKAAMGAAKASSYAPATHNCAAVPGKYLFKVQIGPGGH